MTTELPAMTAELDAVMRGEQSELDRDTLLWQRWVRYLAVVAMALLSLSFGLTAQRALFPILAIAAVYLGIVMAAASVLRRSAAASTVVLIPVLIVSDIAALVAFSYVASAPDQLYRILLVSLLVTHASAFYFGRRYGTLAAMLAVAAYVSCSLAVPAFIPGARATTAAVAFNAALFAALAAVLVHTAGRFRDRIDALRRYCKIVERGDSVATPQPIAADRWPDGLTLVARNLQSMHAQLAEQVGSDALTGCLNRRSFELRLRTDLRQARRRGSTVAVAAVDLDNFKEINDSHGHAVGDVVLQQVAEIMKATARDTDAVARYGGDEFVIVLPDTGWQGALTFADRLRRRVDDHSFGPVGTPPIDVTISVGVALGRGTEGASTEALLRDADAALYRAKTAGRNRVFS